MNRHVLSVALVLAAACGAGHAASGLDGNDAGAPNDAGADAVAEGGENYGNDGAVSTPALRLSLDPTLDQPDNDAKVTSIAAARLLDKSGAQVAVAAAVDGRVVFRLAGVAAGDYFIELNGDAKDLVPTRIDDPSSDLLQRVGQNLRASFIGPPAKPTYRINTYSAGQKKSGVVRFSDGAALAGEQPYVIVTLATSKLEIMVLGTADALTSLVLNPCAGHANVAADAWLLNTTAQDHHGDLFNADGGSSNCGSCHLDDWMKKADFSWISPLSGWCFRCHYGTDGSGAGFVDPSK